MSVLKIKDQNNNWTQIPTIKGDKGDPFTYADFTPEQLESLKGKDGISPTVSVASDTSDDYRLSFTDETHTVTTPNLIPEAEKILSAYPTDTASGSIASFPDGADDIPLKSCIVRVDPVQDLHGYDSPWPAGGGKNLFQTTATTQTLYGTTFTVNADGTVTVVGTPTVNINGGYSFGEVMLPAGNYKLNGNSNPNTDLRLTCYNVTTSSVIASIYNNNDLSFTLSEESVVRLYPFVSTSFGGSAITIKPMIRLASDSDATFAPYENICPISGFTGCEVQKAGQNLIPENIPAYFYHVNPSASKGAFVGSGTAFSTFIIPVPKGKICLARTTRSLLPYGALCDELPTVGANAFEVITMTNRNNQVFDNSEGHKYFAITVNRSIEINSDWESFLSTEPRLTISDDVQSYTAPTDISIHSIDWTDSAGTVYGGYVDPINGEIVAEYVRKRVNSDLGPVNFSTSRVRYTVSDAMPINAATSISDANIMCSHFPKVSTSSEAGCRYSYGDDYAVAFILFQKIDAFGITNTIDGWNTFLESHEVYVTYKLAEPIHYTLTAIDIKTLLGQNNIWSDAGDTEVTYRADTTLYIKRLTDSDTDMIVDSNIVSGQYFMVGNNLYRATANIASGASVIVGTNATRVSLAQALNEIKEA